MEGHYIVGLHPGRGNCATIIYFVKMATLSMNQTSKASGTLENTKIGFWGCGKIAQAMTKGFIFSGVIQPQNITAVASSPNSANLASMKSLGTVCCASIEEMVDAVDIVVLAIEPHDTLQVLRKHALVSRPQGPPKVLLSAVAGVTIADMKKAYGESPVGDGEKTDFIFSRCVPNLATAVGEGVCCVSVEEDRKDHADCSSLLELLSLLGYCRLLPEHLMSATTACAGSGLGFMMVVLEAMSDAGVLVGHSRATAQEMAIQVMMGAAKLCKEEKLHPAQIKDSVCSPGGTTITGVHELERCGLRNSILSACKAARDKADAFGKK